MSEKYPPELYRLKLFGKYSFEGIEVKDPGLKRYICLKPMIVPHSGGMHEHKRFGKAKVNIVERLVNMLMRPGKMGGKKAHAINIVKAAFAIIEAQTGRNPIEVLVRAVENAAPNEDVTRIIYGGVVYHVSVDVSPQRRLDLALRNIANGARQMAFSSRMSLGEALAREIILAANNDKNSYAIRAKLEQERIAEAAR